MTRDRPEGVVQHSPGWSSRDRDLRATAPVSVRTSVGPLPGKETGMTTTDATQAIKALWRLVLIRGVLAVVFGLYALFAPASALLALVFVFGFYAIMDGVAALALGVRNRRNSHWGWQVVQGVASLLAGLVALFWPGPTVLALVLIIGVWSIVRGAAEIVEALAARRMGSTSWGWLLA